MYDCAKQKTTITSSSKHLRLLKPASKQQRSFFVALQSVALRCLKAMY